MDPSLENYFKTPCSDITSIEELEKAKLECNEYFQKVDALFKRVKAMDLTQEKMLEFTTWGKARESEFKTRFRELKKVKKDLLLQQGDGLQHQGKVSDDQSLDVTGEAKQLVGEDSKAKGSKSIGDSTRHGSPNMNLDAKSPRSEDQNLSTAQISVGQSSIMESSGICIQSSTTADVRESDDMTKMTVDPLTVLDSRASAPGHLNTYSGLQPDQRQEVSATAPGMELAIVETIGTGGTEDSGIRFDTASSADVAQGQENKASGCTQRSVPGTEVHSDTGRPWDDEIARSQFALSSPLLHGSHANECLTEGSDFGDQLDHDTDQGSLIASTPHPSIKSLNRQTVRLSYLTDERALQLRKATAMRFFQDILLRNAIKVSIFDDQLRTPLTPGEASVVPGWREEVMGERWRVLRLTEGALKQLPKIAEDVGFNEQELEYLHSLPDRYLNIRDSLPSVVLTPMKRRNEDFLVESEDAECEQIAKSSAHGVIQEHGPVPKKQRS